MASSVWSEVDKVREENRYELILTGDEIANRIAESGGFDARVFQLVSLNFLEISRCGLDTLSDHVGALENLFHLVLRGNRLARLPASVGQLRKLKLLDVSGNELTAVPAEIGTLRELQTLNASCNRLEEFCDVSQLQQLHELDLSNNQLSALPSGVSCPDLGLLSTVRANGNRLKGLPVDLPELPSLKLLDVSGNSIEVLPPELADCCKLKELKVSGNPLKDRRLLKMVEQCATKSVLDYLRNILEKERKAKGGKEAKGGDKKDRKKRGGKSKEVEVEDVAQNFMKVLHFNVDGGLIVKTTANISAVRPFIVCCIVRNLNFNKSKSMMKRFILLQTKLHDGVCAKRQAATIATHDLDLVKFPLTYDAQLPDELKIIPLGKKKEVSAAVLVGRLRHEADELRKEKKRNTISGIHKYLDLLKDKTHFPSLLDSSNAVISFPPITNAEMTKVSHKTKHVFVEVTSSVNLETCKKVMDELLASLLSMGIGCAEPPPDPPTALSPDDATESSETDRTGDEETAEDDGESHPTAEQVLVLEQVKVVDHLGTLKVIYPSRIDLQSQDYRVVRDYEQ